MNKWLTFSLIFLGVLLAISGCARDPFLYDSLDEGMSVKTSESVVNFKNQPIFGSVNSPVKIVYYYDYQCRWCRDFELKTMPGLKKYIDDGTIQITFKDLVFIGKDSMKGALFSECVYQMYGKEAFLEFHSSMYEKQKTKNTGWITDDLLQGIVENSSLDYDELKKCLSEQTYLENIMLDTDEARFNGITSTPTFIINNKKISGSLPLTFFEELIYKEEQDEK